MASEVAGAGTRASREPAGDSSASPERSGRRSLSGSLHWWSELIIVLAFYGVYTFIRNQFGSDLGQSVKQTAIDNAYDVIAWERAVHLFGEKGIQDLFIEWDLFIQFWNIFYGFCHFAVTISVMVFLFLAIRALRHSAHRAGLHHRAGAGRLRPLPAHAAPAAQRLQPSAPATPTTPTWTPWWTRAGSGRSTPAP